MYNLLKDLFTSLFMIGLLCGQLQGAVNIKKDKNEIRLTSDKLQVIFDLQGDMKTLSRTTPEGKAVWTLNLPKDSFWFTSLDKKKISPYTSKLVSMNYWENSVCAVLKTVHESSATQLTVELEYRIEKARPELLLSRYTIQSGRKTDESFRFYMATIGNLSASNTSWVVYPYRSGKLFRCDKLKNGERPAPGHMWMQFMGHYDSKGNGIITYPEDASGFLKYANHWARNGVTLSWSDVVPLPSGARYSLPFDYVVRPLATPNDFNDICNAYAEWGRKQSWCKTLSEKIPEKSKINQLTENGIVKVVSFGALSMSKSKWIPVPSKTFIPREKKEEMAHSGDSPDRILEKMHQLEKLYSIKPVYRYDGWWGRFDSEYPFVLPVHSALGGDKKFKWFMEENKRENRIVVLHDNPVECDTENQRFDASQMACNIDGKPAHIGCWSGNRMGLTSPYFAIPNNLEVLLQLKQWGVTGIFWDVIGALSPYIDYNKSAHYPYIGRDSFHQGVVHLFAALRNTAPQMLFGTEDGQESLLPYFDYAPAYFGYGDGKTVTWAPLNELVYGDCFVNAVGIDGNNRTYDNYSRTVRRLFGATLGNDSRSKWPGIYEPAVQAIFENNRVISMNVASQRMQRHIINPSGWRASVWPNAVVIANVESERPLNITLDTPLGKVSVEKLRRNGFIMMTNKGSWTIWGAHQLSCNGKVVVGVSSPEQVVIKNDIRLTVINYLFREPNDKDKASIKGKNWNLSCPELFNQLKSDLKSWPDGHNVPVKQIGSVTVQFPMAGFSESYRMELKTKK